MPVRRPPPHAPRHPTRPATPRASRLPDQSYGAGAVVSYNGHQWTANQWSYDEVPGGSSGAWTDDGAC